MPRKPGKVPSYCHHKASGQAVVRINGRDRYLGEYGSPESHQEYERLVAEWRLASKTTVVPPATKLTARRAEKADTVNAMILAYLKHAKAYYTDCDGNLSREYEEMVFALRPVRKLYGRTRWSATSGRWRSRRCGST